MSIRSPLWPSSVTAARWRPPSPLHRRRAPARLRGRAPALGLRRDPPAGPADAEHLVQQRSSLRASRERAGRASAPLGPLPPLCWSRSAVRLVALDLRSKYRTVCLSDLRRRGPIRNEARCLRRSLVTLDPRRVVSACLRRLQKPPPAPGPGSRRGAPRLGLARSAWLPSRSQDVVYEIKALGSLEARGAWCRSPPRWRAS